MKVLFTRVICVSITSKENNNIPLVPPVGRQIHVFVRLILLSVSIASNLEMGLSFTKMVVYGNSLAHFLAAGNRA